MSIEAEQEMRLSAQLTADSNGVECTEMRKLFRSEELSLQKQLGQSLSSEEQILLRQLLDALKIADQAIESVWAMSHAVGNH